MTRPLQNIWMFCIIIEDKSSSSTFCWYIEKILPTSYFGHFWQVWLIPSKTIIPTCWCLGRYVKFLFWLLWAFLVMRTQNDGINLWKTSMFICIPKMNFIIHFFLEILHFRESCNLISWTAIWPIWEMLEYTIETQV